MSHTTFAPDGEWAAELTELQQRRPQLLQAGRLERDVEGFDLHVAIPQPGARLAAGAAGGAVDAAACVAGVKQQPIR